MPPGRARLATRPVPTGSPATANTIGMSDVACFAAIYALQIISDLGTLDMMDQIAAKALLHRLPTCATDAEYPLFGGFMAYGAPRSRLFVRSAYYVKKILEGAKPGDLPVEQPTRVELWVKPQDREGTRYLDPEHRPRGCRPRDRMSGTMSAICTFLP